MRFSARWAGALAVVVLVAALASASPVSAQGFTVPVTNPAAVHCYFCDANFPPRVSYPGRGFNLAAALAAQNRANIALQAGTSAQAQMNATTGVQTSASSMIPTAGSNVIIGGQQIRTYQVLPYTVPAPVLTVPNDMFPGSIPPNMDAGTPNVRATGILPATGISPTTGSQPVTVPTTPGP